MADTDFDERERSLRAAAENNLLAEARVLLPGVKALFGFQLIVVFSDSFHRVLPRPEQLIHYAAIGLTAFTIVLLLAPVAYHRQAVPSEPTDEFLWWAGLALAIAMAPLALALALDLHVVGYAIVGHRMPAILIAASVLVSCSLLWFVVPIAKRMLRR